VTYHPSPCLVFDATVELPHETDCKKGYEEGIGTEVGLVTIECSFKGANIITDDLTIGKAFVGVARRDSHYEVESEGRWWLEDAPRSLICSERVEEGWTVVCLESGVVLEMIWETADGGQPEYLISSSSGQTNRCLAIRASWRHNHLPGTSRSQSWHLDRNHAMGTKCPQIPAKIRVQHVRQRVLLRGRHLGNTLS
jgi:hypothetical protein